jgi:hypothetical protein
MMQQVQPKADCALIFSERHPGLEGYVHGSRMDRAV